MGLITFGIIAYLVRAARQRFAKGGTRLKDSIIDEETDAGDTSTTMKEKTVGQNERNIGTQWADVSWISARSVGIGSNILVGIERHCFRRCGQLTHLPRLLPTVDHAHD